MLLRQRWSCPAPASQAGERVWACPSAPPAWPPDQSQTSQQPGEGPTGSRASTGLGISYCRTLWCLPTGFSSCPHGMGTRVLPSADHPPWCHPWQSASPAKGTAQHGWMVRTVVAAGPGLGDREQRQLLSAQPQAGGKGSPATAQREGTARDSSAQALGQPRRVRKARWVGIATGLEPEAELSRAPSDGGEFNGRVARSSQPFRPGPASLQQTRASPARRC